MANHPQMPASMPIAQQRVVRGNAVQRFPGSGIGLPRFSWPGVVDSLDTSPGWLMDGAMTLLEAGVVMASEQDQITFDVIVSRTDPGDGSISVVATDTVTTTAVAGVVFQRYDINVAVILNDWVVLELTDFGAGICDDLSVVLRPFVTPTMPEPG